MATKNKHKTEGGVPPAADTTGATSGANVSHEGVVRRSCRRKATGTVGGNVERPTTSRSLEEEEASGTTPNGTEEDGKERNERSNTGASNDREERRGEGEPVSTTRERRCGGLAYDPEDKSWTCEPCNERLNVLKEVKRHVSQRHSNGKMTYSCSGCRNFNSETARSLPSHGRYCKGPAPSGPIKPFPCSLCSTSYDSKSGLSQHTRVKHPET